MVAIVLGLVAIGPLVVGAIRLRRRFLLGLTPAAGAVAVAVIVVAAVVGAAEALGTVGDFRRIAMCVVLGAVGAVACRIGTGTGAATEPRALRSSTPLIVSVVAVAAVAVVVAAWAVRIVASLRHGMETVDTLWYHMPTAARFVQTGSTTALHYVDPDPVTVFYPATSPLLHGFAMQLFGNDFLSPFLNLGWLALALAASWAIGEPYDVAPATLVGGCIIVGTPGFVSTQPGGAYTDIVGLALFLSAVALLLQAGRHPRLRAGATTVAAIAAGLALGTKFTYLAPVGVLTLVVLFDRYRSRDRDGAALRDSLAWCIPVFLTGGYFYVRNAVRVGNPLPSTAFGPLHLPAPHVQSATTTVAHFMLMERIWSRYYVPGLWDSLGPAWWAILGLTIVGCAVVVFVARDTFQRLLAAVVLVTIVAYVFTPQFLGIDNAPIFFGFNVRYVSPALALGLCLLPTTRGLTGKRLASVVIGAYVVIFAVTQIGPTVWSWSSPQHPRSLFIEYNATSDVTIGVLVGVVVLVVGLALTLRRRQQQWAALPRWSAAGALALIAIVLGYPLQETYLSRRYQSSPPMPSIYRWAQREHHRRIGVVGIDLQYPLYGKDLSNYVQYIGRREPHGGFATITACATWRRAVNAGHFDYVVIVPAALALGLASPAPEIAWTLHGTSNRVVRQDGPKDAPADLVQIMGPMDPDGCEAS